MEGPVQNQGAWGLFLKNSPPVPPPKIPHPPPPVPRQHEESHPLRVSGPPRFRFFFSWWGPGAEPEFGKTPANGGFAPTHTPPPLQRSRWGSPIHPPHRPPQTRAHENRCLPVAPAPVFFTPPTRPGPAPGCGGSPAGVRGAGGEVGRIWPRTRPGFPPEGVWVAAPRFWSAEAPDQFPAGAGRVRPPRFRKRPLTVSSNPNTGERHPTTFPSNICPRFSPPPSPPDIVAIERGKIEGDIKETDGRPATTVYGLRVPWKGFEMVGALASPRPP